LRFIVSAIVGIAISALFVLTSALVLDFDQTKFVQVVYHVVTVDLQCAFLGYWRERYVRQVFVGDIDLGSERKYVEGILHDLIPARIVSELKLHDPPIVESVGEATVLFADIEGFTQLATRLGPEHLLEVLDRMFRSLDEISASFGVEKVKTIGDCYMAVALPRSGGNASAKAIKCSLAWQEAARAIGDSLGIPLRLRIGAHTGPVIGGIVGARRWAYDYWGTTVNTASRIESAAEPGQVLVSEATYWRAKDVVAFEPVGMVDLRGQGPVQCYRVVAP
jgi:class 3 adenylate cyclase